MSDTITACIYFRFVEDESNAEEHLFILAKFLEKLIGKLSKAVKEARIKNVSFYLVCLILLWIFIVYIQGVKKVPDRFLNLM